MDRLLVGYAGGVVFALLGLWFLRTAVRPEADRRIALHEYRSAKQARSNPRGLVLLHLAASRPMALFGAALCLAFAVALFWPK